MTRVPPTARPSVWPPPSAGLVSNASCSTGLTTLGITKSVPKAWQQPRQLGQMAMIVAPFWKALVNWSSVVVRAPTPLRDVVRRTVAQVRGDARVGALVHRRAGAARAAHLPDLGELAMPNALGS